MTLTEIIERAEALLVGVTPGPWEAANYAVFAGKNCIAITDTDNATLARYEANANFIAGSRQLIADVAALRKASAPPAVSASRSDYVELGELLRGRAGRYRRAELDATAKPVQLDHRLTAHALEEAAAAITKLEEKNAELARVLDEQAEELADSETGCETAERDLAEAHKARDDLDHELRLANGYRIAAETERDTLRADLAAANKRVSEAVGLLQELRHHPDHVKFSKAAEARTPQLLATIDDFLAKLASEATQKEKQG